MRRTFSWLPWVLLILVIAGFFAWQQYQKPKAPVASDGIKMPAEKVEPLINTTRTGGVVSYSAAVKVAAPAVVNIFTTQKVKQLDHPLLNDPALAASPAEAVMISSKVLPSRSVPLIRLFRLTT